MARRDNGYRDHGRGSRSGHERPSLRHWVDDVIAEAAALDHRNRYERERSPYDSRDEIFEALEHLARRIGANERADRPVSPQTHNHDVRDLETTLKALLARAGAGSEPDSRPDPVAQAITNLERRLDDISTRIDSRFEATASRADPLLDGIRQRLETLATRIDAPPQTRLDPDHEARLGRIEEALNGLSNSVTRHESAAVSARDADRMSWSRDIVNATAANPELVSAVREIAERQKALEANFDPDTTMRAIDGRLARYSDDLARRIDEAPRNAVADLQERLRAMIDEPSQTMRGEVGRLQAQVANLQDEISNAVSGTSLAAIVDEVRHLSGKLDEARRSGTVTEGLSRIEREMTAIREVVQTATPREALVEIDSKIGALARRLDEFGAATDPDTVKRISAQLGHVQRVVSEAMPLEAFKTLVSNIQSIDSKLTQLSSRSDTAAIESLRAEIVGMRDVMAKPPAPIPAFDELRDEIKGLRSTMARPPASTPAFDELRDEIRGLRTTMDKPPTPQPPAFDPTVLDDFRGRFERLQHSVARQSGTETAIKALEAQLQSLGTRIDGATRPQIPETLVEDIRSQIGEIAKRSPAMPFAAIEKQIGDLTGKIDAISRRGGERGLESLEAHIKTLADRFGEITPASSRDPLIETLHENFEALRSSTHTNERRTAETLSAVHDTLIKVMDRLDTLDRKTVQPTERQVQVERQIIEPRLPTAQTIETARTTQPLPSLPQQADAAPDPAPRENSARGVIAAARAAAMRAAEQLKSEPAPAPAAKQTREVPVHSAGDDAPLEPGSGRPGMALQPQLQTPLQVPAASVPAATLAPAQAIDPAMAGENLRQSFIAAARRAAQAATAEAEAKPTKSKTALKLESLGAKAKAKPEPARTEDSSSEAKAGFVGKIVDTLKTRRKQVVMTMGALVIVIGALQVVSLLSGPTGNSAQAPAPAAPSVAATTQTGAPVRSEARIAPGSANEAARTASTSPATPGANPEVARAGVPELPQGITSGRLRQAVEAGEARAIYEVGIRLFEGRGVQRDSAAAARWLRLAADQDHAPAIYRLGNMLERGDAVVRRDIPEAMRLYERAAAAGNRKAMHNLAALVAASNPPDYERAFRLFDQAANLGLVDSQYNLAVLHVNGLGTRQNLVEAYRWFAISAQNGDQEAGRQRDQIGARLEGQALITTRTAAQGFRPQAMNAAANEEIIPAHVWEDTAERPTTSSPVTASGVPQRPTELGVNVGTGRRS
jgi:localization factor PodJL